MSDLPNGIPALIEKKLQEERKLIVDWLSNPKDITSAFGGFDPLIVECISDVIERGEYRKGEGE